MRGEKSLGTKADLIGGREGVAYTAVTAFLTTGVAALGGYGTMGQPLPYGKILTVLG